MGTSIAKIGKMRFGGCVGEVAGCLPSLMRTANLID